MNSLIIPTVKASVTAAAVLVLVGCSAFERTFGPAKADFGGGAAIQFLDVPAPDESKYAVGELDMRVNSDLIGPEQRAELGKRILETVGERFKPWTTRTKEPQFRLVINQINSQQEFEGSNVGALMGGMAGAGAGAAIGANNRWQGAMIGGAGGAGVGYLMFGEERNAWAFAITVTQATCQVDRNLAATRRDGASFNTSVQGGSGVSGGGQDQHAVDDLRLSFKSGLYTYAYACTVSVDAGSLHGRQSIEEAARNKLISRLPEAMLGGGEIRWGQQ